MQVERDPAGSNIGWGEWRKGEEHVNNLSIRWGKPLETTANTECGVVTHVMNAKGGPQGLSLNEGFAHHQLVGGVTAHQGLRLAGLRG